MMYFLKITYKYALKLLEWIVYSLIVQLFLLSFSYPILVSWGICFSPLVFIGTLIFTPFLTAFLAVSCVIYCFEWLFIPSDYCCYLLEWIAFIWIYCMKSVSVVSYKASPQAPLFILSIMPLGAIAIIKINGLKSLYKTLTLLLLWIIIIFIAIKWLFTPSYKEIFVPCGDCQVIAVLNNGHVFLYDESSAFSSRSCNKSWINYTLSPALIKHFGVNSIALLEARSITRHNIENIRMICHEYTCKKVIDRNGKLLQI